LPLGAEGRGWLRLLAGLVLIFGILSAVTFAVFVTHPCGHLGKNEFATCGAARPALVVGVVTVLLAASLLFLGRRHGQS
jgi:hypothetical protein